MVCIRRSAGALALVALVCAAFSVAEEPAAPDRPSDPPSSVLSRALKSIEAGRPAGALRELEPLVDEHPDSATLHFHLGLAREKQQRYVLAAEHFRRTLELDPGLHAARAPLGWCLYYLGQLDGSRQAFERYLSVVPTDARALLALALIEFDGDRLDGARARLLQAIELTRLHEDTATEALARARLADVELRAGQLEAARRLLVVAIKLDPQNESYYYKLARVLQRIGDTDGAQRVLRRRDEVSAGPVSKERGP